MLYEVHLHIDILITTSLYFEIYKLKNNWKLTNDKHAQLLRPRKIRLHKIV
jgi:hypothetical protein